MRCARAWIACLAAATAPTAWTQDACPEQNLESPNGPGAKVTKDCLREEGTFRNGRLWGRGKVTTQDGTVYEGDFIDGRLWGHGRMTRAAPRKSWYEGAYHNGVATGVGRSGDENGVVYNGFFHNGVPYGIGVATFPHGGKLLGEFRPGLGGVGEFVAMLPDGTEHTGAYRPMYGKLVLYRPPEGPTAPAARAPVVPPGKVPEPANAPDPGKAKADVEKAVDVLRGLLKR
jgi:hypothetical protein